LDEASATEIRWQNAWRDASEENRKQLDEEEQGNDSVNGMIKMSQQK
jgi:hypothetical protein